MPLQMFGKRSNGPFNQIGRVIAVASGKGGVGKSTVAVNMALTLSNMGYKVGLIDTDIYGPSVRKMLPEDRMPCQKEKWIQPALCHGISVISMAFLLEEGQSAAVRAPIANGIVKQFLTQVLWGDLDFLIIDFPPGTGDIQLTLSQQANISGAVMVTSPQNISVMDVKKAMHLFKQVNIPIIGVVENMSYFRCPTTGQKHFLFGKGGGANLANEKGVPFLGEIPIDPQLSMSADLGQNMTRSEGCIEIKNIFEKLTEKILMQINAIGDVDDEVITSFSLQWKDLNES